MRCGPAPCDTADGGGGLHSDFTDWHSYTLKAAEAALLRESPAALYDVAAAFWRRATAEGHGHILIGKHDGFECVVEGAGGCGSAAWGVSPDGYPIRPKNYEALFAVARAERPADQTEGPGSVDLAVDYRGSKGPGDPAVRPAIFGAGA